MRKESKITQAIRWAVTEGGYSVDRKGNPSGPNGPLAGHVKKKGERRPTYLHITVTNSKTGFRCPIPVHRMIAFLKYGEDAFSKGVVTRHINGDSLDNRWKNIVIGTQSDNMYDQDKEELVRHARVAAQSRRRFTKKQVEEILRRRASGWTYKRLSEFYKMSEGGLCDIVKGNQYQEFDELRKELGI